MAYTINLEPGEQLIKELSYVVSKKVKPFCFAVTNRALYVPAKKLIAVSDPYYYRRVPNHEVSEVTIRRMRPYALWFLAAVMFVAGLIVTILMMSQFSGGHVPKKYSVSGWPAAICVGGLLIPFAAHGRRGLLIQWASGSFRWTPPLVIDRASKQRIADTFQDIAAACREARLHVTLDSDANSAAQPGRP
jgi:hypothetical protein